MPPDSPGTEPVSSKMWADGADWAWASAKMTREDLPDIARHLEEEARMVLPGIQALFGFQLIAVFNSRFTDLSPSHQTLHFIALLCTAIAVLLVLTPAAYHRQIEPTGVSLFFCRMGSILLTASLFPLAVAISLDLFVIGTLILGSAVAAAVIAGLIFLALIGAWFVFPHIASRRPARV